MSTKSRNRSQMMKCLTFLLLWMSLFICPAATEDDDDITFSRQEPLKLEIKNSDLIKPESKFSTGSTSSSTLARSTTTPWASTEITSHPFATLMRHSTAQPIIRVILFIFLVKVNFTNILRAAFTCKDPKSTKRLTA